MFILKGKNGETLTSCSQEYLDQEITFKSYDEAKTALEAINFCMPDSNFTIQEK